MDLSKIISELQAEKLRLDIGDYFASSAFRLSGQSRAGTFPTHLNLFRWNNPTREPSRLRCILSRGLEPALSRPCSADCHVTHSRPGQLVPVQRMPSVQDEGIPHLLRTDSHSRSRYSLHSVTSTNASHPSATSCASAQSCTAIRAMLSAKAPSGNWIMSFHSHATIDQFLRDLNRRRLAQIVGVWLKS